MQPGKEVDGGGASEQQGHASVQGRSEASIKKPAGSTTAADAVLAGSAAVAQLLGTGFFGGKGGEPSRPAVFPPAPNSGEKKDQGHPALSTSACAAGTSEKTQGTGAGDAAGGGKIPEKAGSEAHVRNDRGEALDAGVPHAGRGAESEGHSSDASAREASGVPETQGVTGERKEEVCTGSTEKTSRAHSVESNSNARSEETPAGRPVLSPLT